MRNYHIYLSANYVAKCATNLFRNMNAIQNCTDVCEISVKKHLKIYL